jgi:CheY-like chemotaxis protein
MGALPQNDAPEPPSARPPADPPARVEAESIHTAGERDELSYNELGNVDPGLSVVTDVPAATPSTPPLSQPSKTILVVDDEADIRKILNRVLTSKGYEVVEADRGLEALRLVKAHMPDLILLDAMLPEVQGFEIARRVKSSQKYAHIPIVMVSAVYKGWRYAEDAKQSYGVDAYLEKPFRIQDVMAAVEAAIHGTEMPAIARPKSERPPPIVARGDTESLSHDAERCLSEGVAAYQAGDLDGAIAHLKRGIAIDAFAYRLHFHLGLLYGKKGLVYEAIAELERAVEQNDRHFPALKNLAVLYQKAGFKNKAIETWERALRVAPDDATRATIKQHVTTLL